MAIAPSGPPAAGSPSSLADVQSWDAGSYAANARFVATLGSEIASWLAPKPGERILDLGCGDGVLTAKLVAAGAAVVGVDTAPSMLAAARALGLDARFGDARELGFEAEFDAVFSNAVLHWVTEPERAAHSIRRALRPGGQFVAEFGGHGNVAAVATALRAVAHTFGGDAGLAAPWFYPTEAEYAAILEGAAFRVDRIVLVPRPTPLPTGIEGWLETMRRPFFDQFAGRRAQALAYAVTLLRPSLCDRAGQWTADYVRLRVHASAA